MYLALWTLAGLLICYSGFSSACKESDAEKCFAQMAEDLGNGEPGMTGMELFTLLNPPSSNYQKNSCSNLKNHHYSAAKQCVAKAQCADTSILPPDMVGPSIPVITWSSVVDYIEGICQPGCEDMASKNLKIQQCAQSGGNGNNNDMCGSFDPMFDCFRSAIGSCEVLASFTESMLGATGMVDMIKQMCPNVNTALGKVAGSKEYRGEIEKDNEEKGSKECSEETVQACFVSMSQELGIPADQMNNNDLMDLVNPGQGSSDPASINAEQKKVCNLIANYDMSIVRSCIASSGCGDESILPSEVAGMPGAPTLTWMTVVDLLEGICRPGCENMGTMNQEVQQCNLAGQGGGGDPCGAMESTFDCFRDSIGSCDVMVSFTNGLLSSTGVIDMVKGYCPNVNLDLSTSEIKKRNNNIMEIKNLHKRLSYLTLPNQLHMFNAAKRFHTLNVSKRLNMLKQERALKALKAFNVHSRS